MRFSPIVWIAFCFLFHFANGAVQVYVGNNGNYSSIIDALDAIDQDTDIILRKGRHYFYSSADVSPFVVTFLSEDPSDPSTIYCDNAAFYISSKATTFRSIRVEDCFTTFTDSGSLLLDDVNMTRSGPQLANCLSVSIVNSIFTYGKPFIIISSQNVSIHSCTISDSLGEFSIQLSSATISNTTFLRYPIVRASVIDRSTVHIISSTFQQIKGSIMEINQSSIFIDHSQFLYNNNSGSYGGILVYTKEDSPIRSDLTVNNSLFMSNLANNGVGGCISAYHSELFVYNSQFMNSAAQKGAAISVEADSTLSVVGSSFTWNYAYSAGAAIDSSNSIVDIQSSIFSNNAGGNNGGGSISIVGSDKKYNKANITNSMIEYSSTSYIGGGLFGDTITISLNNCTISYNSATAGAGAFFKNANVTIIGGSFIANQASTGAGGVYLGLTYSSINGTLFSSNNAVSYGGAIYSIYDTSIIQNCVFSNNSYSFLNTGGSVMYSHSSSILLSHNRIDPSNMRIQLNFNISSIRYLSSDLSNGINTCQAKNTTLECFPNCSSVIVCDYIDVMPSTMTTTSSSTTTTAVDSSSNSPKNNKNNRSVGIGVGVSLSIVLIIVIAAIIFFIIRRRKHQRDFVDMMGFDMNTTTSTKKPSSLYSHLELTDIVQKERLGGGHFGQVYLGLWNNTTKVAMKSLKGGSEVQAQFEREADLLFKLNHPNIVRALGIYRKSEEEFFLVLEFCKLGSLDSFLVRSDHQSKLNTSKLLKLCMDIAAGCKFMEQKGIIHRDLGARNVLVTEVDGDFTAKISDLGLSRETNLYIAEQKDIPYKWSSPETIINGSSTTASDVWSFGVTMWEVFSFGQQPYQGLSNKDVIDQVAHGNLRLLQPKKLS